MPLGFDPTFLNAAIQNLGTSILDPYGNPFLSAIGAGNQAQAAEAQARAQALEDQRKRQIEDIKLRLEIQQKRGADTERKRKAKAAEAKTKLEAERHEAERQRQQEKLERESEKLRFFQRGGNIVGLDPTGEAQSRFAFPQEPEKAEEEKRSPQTANQRAGLYQDLVQQYTKSLGDSPVEGIDFPMQTQAARQAAAQRWAAQQLGYPEGAGLADVLAGPPAVAAQASGQAQQEIKKAGRPEVAYILQEIGGGGPNQAQVARVIEQQLEAGQSVEAILRMITEAMGR